MNSITSPPLYMCDVTVGLCGICPAPPPLRLDGWAKSDSEEHSILPKVEHFSTLGDQLSAE